MRKREERKGKERREKRERKKRESVGRKDGVKQLVLSRMMKNRKKGRKWDERFFERERGREKKERIF